MNTPTITQADRQLLAQALRDVNSPFANDVLDTAVESVLIPSKCALRAIARTRSREAARRPTEPDPAGVERALDHHFAGWRSDQWEVQYRRRAYITDTIRAYLNCPIPPAAADRADRDASVGATTRETPDVAAGGRGAFQENVRQWLLACFGPKIAADKIERNHRFIEEALELVQAAGCTQSEAHQLVDYVFNRPVGEIEQEIGGVMITLAALCLAHGFDMVEAGDKEMLRVWSKVEQIRAKHAAKPKHSPLPEHAPGHTDLMVPPETIDKFLTDNPLPDPVSHQIATLTDALCEFVQYLIVAGPVRDKFVAAIKRAKGGG